MRFCFSCPSAGRDRVLRFLVIVVFALVLSSLRASTTAAESEASARRVDATCALEQALQQFHDALARGELSAIHDEEMKTSVALTMLGDAPPVLSADRSVELRAQLQQLGRHVAALHGAADAADGTKAAAELAEVDRLWANARGLYDPKVLAAADEAAARYTCPMHADVVGARESLCPKCGMPLDQMIRPALFRPGVLQPTRTIKAAVFTDAPLEVGHETRAVLHLSRIRGNAPVTLDDLREAHTRKIHLLIVDASLSDYHHEHPEPLASAGDYAFRFTPTKPGAYRVWADLRPAATGFQEYASTDIPGSGAGEPIAARDEVLACDVGGRHYALSFAARPLVASRSVAATLRITTADGKPFTRCEPLMAAYVHLVGFSENRETVLHLHPKGAPVLSPESRGGPEFTFQFFAPASGFVRLFAQVQIDGKSEFAPFSVIVAQ